MGFGAEEVRPISVVFGGMRSQGWGAGSRILARKVPIGWRSPGSIGDNNGNDKIISNAVKAERLMKVPVWWRIFREIVVSREIVRVAKSSSSRSRLRGAEVGQNADDGHAYLGLVAQAVGAIDPDVLSQNFAFLVKLHVLGQLAVMLETTSDQCGRADSYVGGIRHDCRFGLEDC